MSFESVYDLLTPPGVFRKTKSWHWLDGTQLRAYWTLTQIVGSTTTATMNDVADGGLRLTTGGADDDEGSINFNNIRHYSNTASKIIAVMQREANARTRAGFSENTDMSNSFALVENDSDDSFYLLTTDDGTTETTTNSSVSTDTTLREHRIRLTSASVLLSIDGVLEVAKTTNRPDAKQQPFFAVKARSAAAANGDILRLEAYST